MAKRRLKALSLMTMREASQTSDTSSPRTLTDLPVELIWHIASYLTTPTLICDFDFVTVREREFDLCALRLVCRSLHDKVQDVFLPAAFHTLDVDLTRSHLDALIEISENSKYAATVRELHFVMAEAWPDHPDDWSEDFEQERMERNHLERGTGAILLSRALKGFSALTTVRIKPVMWFPGNSRFTLARWPHGEGSTTSLMATILAALGLSDSRITTLSCSRVITSKHELNGPTGCHISQFDMPASSRKAFQHLQTLDLIIAVRPSKLFDPDMATAFTTFLLSLKQLVSLSIRFDCEPLSELVTCDFLSIGHMKNLTRFRLEMAWINDTIIDCPLILFIQHNKQIQHFHLAFVDLHGGQWPELFETLRTECEDLRSVEVWCPGEGASGVLFKGQKFLRIRESDDIQARLTEAQHEISVMNQPHDGNSFARYERYRDDSEYDPD
ncbi:hypothetical protein E8E13_005345 [Curvularia kusanoi]|uniref:F-box domain-containing protein n=1 Tax=Curvularia kusanoi TaxID=90978 RepID=A0A9P4TA80_CURKU|nr:hypothetical protein E8E13_005345 [Curvularia kusanoi]